MLASFFSTWSFAENRAMLKGIKEISILVEYLDSHDEACGLNENQIKNELEYVIGRDLEISKKDAGVCYLYFNPNLQTRETTGLCYGTMELQLRCFGRFTNLVNNNDTATHTAILWKTGTVLSAGKSVFRDNYLGVVSDFAKEFVVDWRQNQ